MLGCLYLASSVTIIFPVVNFDFCVSALINFAKKFPKRPGVFPPFALFTQEQREKMLAENGELSFGDSGRMMGELWHKLSDDQKEDYRKRAKDVTDQKLKDWQVMTYLRIYF